MADPFDGPAIGIDTGGTFTDVVLRDGAKLKIHKVLSSPADPSLAIARAVAAVVDATAGAPAIIHGTTVATNALLERRGARVAFVTTAGFEDLLFLRRQHRPELYAFEIVVPAALVGPDACYGVRERIGHDASIIEALEQSSIGALIGWLEAGGFESVAICLLHAYANPIHEQMLGSAIAAALPAMHVSVSHQIVREFREYERASTTSVNAFVGPVMARYLTALSARVDAHRIEILQSHGGRSDIDFAARLPVHTVLSGPAGGVIGALHAAHELGFSKIITFDMGGTSTDVSLCDGEPSLTRWSEIDGLPIGVPVIDIFTVGAGGGSIAAVDAGGALRVGPRSAGASPGPASYAQGGVEPTVTDAHVVLGSLRADRFLGGEMQLDGGAAAQSMRALGEALGMDQRTLARGILDVADASMVRAIKVISLERGLDPRDYTLVAFGGAGGLHACRLAQALEIKRVLVPRHPGLLSAHGMLHADAQRLYGASILRALDWLLGTTPGHDALRGVLAELEAQALEEMGVATALLEISVSAELRYVGQSFEISVPVTWRSGDKAFEDPAEGFGARHELLYGYRAKERAIELVTVRVKASVASRIVANFEEQSSASAFDFGEQHAQVGFGGGDFEASIIERDGIGEGACFLGPAVITEYSGTTVVPAGWRVQCRGGHLILSFEEGQ
ncbi:MAG: hydantoinase/oxoprolinase family protein [Bradymonadaceae bacterium]|nr:hydantoinase/oxoprolinase family protein [Lujinxingiaceae bacterium]